LNAIQPHTGSQITLLGYKGPSGENTILNWRLEQNSLIIDIPEEMQLSENRPSDHAWVFKIDMSKNNPAD
jgi:hypothetical protein